MPEVRAAHKLRGEAEARQPGLLPCRPLRGLREGPDGRVRKRVRKCYLGPAEYIEVSKLHSDLGLTLKGLMEEGRERDYMEALVRSVRNRIRGGRLTAGEARELAAVLSRFSEELKELARELGEYAAGEAAHKEAAKEAVNETVAKKALSGH